MTEMMEFRSKLKNALNNWYNLLFHTSDNELIKKLSKVFSHALKNSKKI